MAGPLDGIRVLDITQAVAGPVGTMLLAELGAEVVKVEFPGIGDLTRMSGFAKGGVNSSVVNCNRGKRSIQVDMKADAGRGSREELGRERATMIGGRETRATGVVPGAETSSLHGSSSLSPQ